MNEQEIFDKMLPLIREVTGVRADQVAMESGLMHDLGAESIDLLDLSFLIEEAFDVTIEADEFERQATERLASGVYEKDGYLTAEAIEELKKALPEVPEKLFKPDLKKIEVPSILTVAVFVHLIERKLAAKNVETRNA